MSRHHCVIAHRDNIAAIVDLGSRNPTVVNGVMLPKGKPKKLKDNDRIQIGRTLFALSLGEDTSVLSSSGSSHSSSLAEEEELSQFDTMLRELDDLATSFGEGKGFQGILPPTKTAVKHSQEKAESETTSLPKALAEGQKKDEQDDDDSNSSTVELPKELVEKLVRSENEGEPNEPEDEEKGPKKIPDHLRPKGTANSQEAAYAALRNLFNNR